MREPDIPDELVLAAFRTFWAKETSGERDAGNAFFDLCRQIGKSHASPERVADFLNDPSQVDRFVDEFKHRITDTQHPDAIGSAAGLLHKIDDTTTRTLDLQRELGAAITRVNALATANRQASHDLTAAAAELTKDVKILDTKVESVKQSLSFWSTLISGMLIGFASGVASSYYYERHLSIAAETARSEASSPPSLTRVVPWSPPQSATPSLLDMFRSNDAHLFAAPRVLPPLPSRDEKVTTHHQDRPTATLRR